MLSEGLKHVSFVQFLADAFLTSDIFIYEPTIKKNKNIFITLLSQAVLFFVMLS